MLAESIFLKPLSASNSIFIIIPACLKASKTTSGIQIDLLIDRNDKVINLCELKFYHDTWSLSQKDRKDILDKVALFKNLSKTKKQVFFTVITTFGIKPNEYSLGSVDNAFSMDVLFEKL